VGRAERTRPSAGGARQGCSLLQPARSDFFGSWLGLGHGRPSAPLLALALVLLLLLLLSLPPAAIAAIAAIAATAIAAAIRYTAILSLPLLPSASGVSTPGGGPFIFGHPSASHACESIPPAPLGARARRHTHADTLAHAHIRTHTTHPPGAGRAGGVGRGFAILALSFNHTHARPANERASK